MARVELDNVSKAYLPRGPRAVDSLSLAVEDREFVVLVGPSGCGKTTTLRMVAGLEEIDAGTIRIGGRVVNDVPPKDRDIAMVFQNYALYPHMTVYKNMAFALKLRGVPRAEIDQRVRAAARTLDLEGLLDRKPRQLSGGQRQRVAVGRAIVREPAAFLFDEPLSNLDAKLRVTTRAELKRLHQRLRTTTIYVTHDQEEAMTLGDRIVVMKDGRIQQADAPLVTYNVPVNRFVAGFIGMPPMNFFDGQVRQADGRLVFVEGKPAAPPSPGKPPAASSDVERLTMPGQGFTLPVPAHLAGALGRWAGRHVTLGIRPEHVRLKPASAGGPMDDELLTLDATVNVIEPLGHDMDVYLETADLRNALVARVEASSTAGGLTIGARVRASVDGRKVHFFEPGETGMNLSLSNEPAHAHA